MDAIHINRASERVAMREGAPDSCFLRRIASPLSRTPIFLREKGEPLLPHVPLMAAPLYRRLECAIHAFRGEDARFRVNAKGGGGGGGLLPPIEQNCMKFCLSSQHPTREIFRVVVVVVTRRNAVGTGLAPGLAAEPNPRESGRETVANIVSRRPSDPARSQRPSSASCN